MKPHNDNPQSRLGKLGSMYDVQNPSHVAKRVQWSSEGQRILVSGSSDPVIRLFKYHMHPDSGLQRLSPVFQTLHLQVCQSNDVSIRFLAMSLTETSMSQRSCTTHHGAHRGPAPRLLAVETLSL
jgi:hypothetical protein